jgi:hypothetical protein
MSVSFTKFGIVIVGKVSLYCSLRILKDPLRIWTMYCNILRVVVQIQIHLKVNDLNMESAAGVFHFATVISVAT